MRKHGWMPILIIFFLFFLPFFNPTAEGATGSIRAKIVLPGDTGAAGSTIPLSIGIQPMGLRPLDGGDDGVVLPSATIPLSIDIQPTGHSPLDGGDGGGGDGGGGDGSDGGGGGDGGYWVTPYAPIESVKILEDRILKLENLNEGLKNLLIKYEKDVKDQSGNVVGKEEFQLALKNIRVVEGQVTDLKDLMMKKGGTINGSIKYAGRTDFPTATVHVVGFAGTSASALPPWMNNRTITATDLAGNFALTNLPEGTYTLAITPGGDAAATHAREVITNIRAVADQTISATPFGPLELTSTMGALGGWVGLFDRPSGPYDGTFVRATSTDGRFRSYIQATDANGYYDFGKIPTGNYRLYIQHPGYKVSEPPDITLTSSGSTQAELWLRSGTKKICGNVGLPDGGQRGDVNNDKKIGIADAVLALQTTTRLNAIAPSLWGEVNSDGKIGLAEAVYALQVASGLRLASGSALSGTLVMIPGTSLMAATDATGNFTIEKVPEKTPGNWTYDLFITRNGYQALRREGVVAQDTCNYTSLSLTLPPHETVVVDGKVVPKGSIMGRAWLKKSTDDYRGIDVAIENTGFVAKPNASGNFIFTDVPPGSYTLNYTNAGYKTVAEAGVLVAPDLTTETRNVVLIPRNGTIKGQVKLEGSTTCGGINVRVEPSEAQIGVSPTDASCNFSISVPENFNVLTNTKCVLNNATGVCTSSPSYNVVAGDQALEELGYITHPFTNVNVPAGETVDLGVVELKKPPAPPSGVTAAQKDGSSVTVSWTASLSTDVAGYNVYYGTRSDAINQKANAALIATQTNGNWQFTIGGLSRGIEYYFTVDAVDIDSLPSAKAPSDGSCRWVLRPDPNKTVSVVSSLGIFNMPLDIVVTGNGSKGYVSLTGAASLYALDLSVNPPSVSSQIVIPLISGNRQPTAMAYNPLSGELYVIDYGQNALFFVNTLNDSIDNTPVATGRAPKNVITDGTKIYVCSSYNGDNKITIIDAASRQVIDQIPLTDNPDPYGMVIVNKKLYVAGQWTGKVYVIDIDSQSSTYKGIKTIFAGANAYDIVARPDGAYVYVSHDTADGQISIIETATDTLLADKTITLRNTGETNSKNPKGMCVHGTILYVVTQGDGRVMMIDTTTNTKLPLSSPVNSGGNGPLNIAVSPDGNKLYIVNEYSNSVEMLSY